MKMMEYWPSLPNIRQCIRTEAEELSDHTLLAVHEPARILRMNTDGSPLAYETEEQLLKHFLEVQRPLPIIGNTGVGKSHIIRWLDANLRLRPEFKNKQWHIVRIPKSASLREVLELLLKGLEGEIFDEAREDINKVSDKRSPKEIAEWLLMLMGQELRDLHARSSADYEQLKQEAAQANPEQQNALRKKSSELKKINIHAAENALPTLINDAYFKQFLLKEEQCLYRFASRLISGANSDELEEGEQQLKASDLDFQIHLSDLSLPTRSYISRTRLNTYEPGRQEAADILNLVLGKAAQTLFNQLFNFRGRSFSDLFLQIRKALHERGMTLMVLVEDMSLITAIEDVLIDSLEREGMRDGEEVLCPVCSAFATTEGYQGYNRRRQGMRDRAKGEWRIEEVVGERSETRQRIVDFCSRYINAARFGDKSLREFWNNRSSDTNWVPNWEHHTETIEESEAFGYSSLGYALYPFNERAIYALADVHCSDGNKGIKFNPRIIINKILLNILSNYRVMAEEGQFPPVQLDGITAPHGLRTWLRRKTLAEQDRAESVAAIWGYPADNGPALASALPPSVARCFGLDDLANELMSTEKGEINSGYVTSVESKVEPVRMKTAEPILVQQKTVEAVDPLEARIIQLENSVSDWILKEVLLDQDTAKYIRNALAMIYDQHAHVDWFGAKSKPDICSGRFVNINIPNAHGYRLKQVVSFITEAEYQKRSVWVTEVSLALARFGFYMDRKNGPDWTYPKAPEDYLVIQSFANRWVPYALTELLRSKRENQGMMLAEQLQLARALGIIKPNATSKEVLNRLLMNKEALIRQHKSAATESIAKLRADALEKWEEVKSQWLNLYAPNDHALEGDIVQKMVLEAMKQPADSRIEQAANRTVREIASTLTEVTYFSDCENSDAFALLIDDAVSLLEELREEGDYPINAELDCSALQAELKSLKEGSTWAMILKLRDITQKEDPLALWQVLCGLDGGLLKRFTDTLQRWQKVCKQIFSAITGYNHDKGGHRISECRAQIDSVLMEMTQNLQILKENAGGSDEHA
ncbi:TPA: protein DpdH [Klebsiella pneumoniae]